MIYLDHAATSPMTKEVIEAMWPYMTEGFGNPSSRHEFGRVASVALEGSRSAVAMAMNSRPSEIVFTGGGTESVNLAIKGTALANPRGRHIVTSAVEHEAVLESCRYLQRHHGFELSVVGVDNTGKVRLDELALALRNDTTVCSVQYANNEVGTIQPVDEISALCRRYDVPFHVDAVQAAGVLPLDIEAQLISISGHKFGGPRGTGVLKVSPEIMLEPVIHGGGQESGLRSGTSNVAGAVGLATALSLAVRHSTATNSHLTGLRDELIERLDYAVLTGHRSDRLPQHASFCFPGINGETLLLELENYGIACSSGSACAAGSDDVSYVLNAMGYADELARTALRFTMSRITTDDDISRLVDLLPRALDRCRQS
jgi:cysteine desulfurase